MKFAAIGGLIVFVIVIVIIGVYFGTNKGSDSGVGTIGGSGTGAADTGAADTVPSGQFVKIIQDVGVDNDLTGNADDKNKILNLAELEVFDESGVNMASGKTVTGSNEGGFKFVNLVDGNKTNFAHTYGGGDIDFLQVDLGAVKKIKKIVITNRADCCQKRAIGIKAVIYGADGKTVIKETPLITNEAATYTLTFPGAKWT